MGERERDILRCDYDLGYFVTVEHCFDFWIETSRSINLEVQDIRSKSYENGQKQVNKLEMDFAERS